jgi:hypothetical protein
MGGLPWGEGGFPVDLGPRSLISMDLSISKFIL